MIEFRATYFDGRSSKAYPVSILFNGVLLRIQGEGVSLRLDIPFWECTLTPPLGRTARTIRLPGGAQCETADLQSVRALERQTGRNAGMRLVHALESRWRTVAASFLTLVVCVWAFAAHGIPFLAEKAAYSVPPELTETMSAETLEMLDKRLLEPSELDPERAAELREAFTLLAEDMDSSHRYRLEFRQGAAVGPNAFALPSGLIVMTDELVELAENDRELEGVLLHEIGHVEKRHGLRSIIQDAGVFLLISALVGDVASITSTAASLPTLLAQTGYSRQFEREADEFAVRYFVHRGWSADPLQDILLRMSEDAPSFPGESILSTHPVTSERIRYIEEMEGSASDKEPGP
jgi:Zn-dependent protease with chaperone function